MNEGEIRLNKTTREWKIYAPSRRFRSQDFKTQTLIQGSGTKNNQNCPFCSVSEEIILEMPCSQGDGWQTRVVLNKYPALIPLGKPKRKTEGIYLTMPGYGKHEVIIEHLQHDRNLALMDLEEVEAIIETYYRRYLALMADPNNLLIIIFRNYGKKAGASLEHLHSQIIATSVVPQRRR